VLALGMFCWGLRYIFFAVGHPYALVFLGILLHGACFDFFFAAGFIHVDNEAPKDIRASGQALFGFLTYGLGMFLGSIVGGYLAEALKPGSNSYLGMQLRALFGGDLTAQMNAGIPPNDIIDWRAFWIVPSIGVLVSLAVFVVFFRMHSRKAGTTTTA
jgi:MFS family permease